MSVQIKGSGTIGGIDEGLNVVGVTTLTGTGEYLLKLNKSDSSAVYAQFTNSTSGTSTTDGFRIGMDSNEDGLVWLREDGNVKFGSNNLERLRINSDGKVGIATDTGNGLINTRHAGTNQQVLHVRADLGSNNGRVLNIFTPDTDNTTAPFRFQTGNGYLFQCDSEDVFTIAHDRRVGIGTNAPSQKLEVQDRSGGTLCGLSVGTQYGNAHFGGYNNYPAIMNSSNQPLIYCDTNNDRSIFFGDTVGFGTTCAFRVNGAERLRITSAGDFGFGISSPTAQAGRVLHLHAGNAQQRFHMTNSTTGTSATDGFEIIVEQSANVRIRNFEAGALMFDTGGSNNEVMRLTSDGLIQAKSLSGSYYPIASVKDGSTSARAATSAWEIKKTLGPRAKTGYYYLENPYDGSVNTWWCDMTTDGGGWILIAHTGEGQMSSLATGDGNHWFNRSNKGGFDTVGSGYYKGGGYWRATNGAWAANTCGQLMWDVRVHNQFGFAQYGYHDTAESNSKVVFNWGTDQALPTGASSLSNIPNGSNRRFNEWCYEVQNAPGFNPNNYHQNVRSNTINGANFFTEHMVMTWSFRNTGGAGDAGSDGPYWMIGSHHDGQHQHYEESLSGSDGVYGDGGYQVVSNQDTYWANNPSGTNNGMRRLAKFDDSGTVNVWLR